MSRAGFSIRKLMHQRRTWPDSDDDTEETFECSSAKTIRVQYELEQYQQQQSTKDGQQQPKERTSWMDSNASPRKKANRKVPKPITITRHASDDVLLKSGSASRRISSPVLVSSLAGRITPRTPLYTRSSEESLESVGEKTSNQAEWQLHHVHRHPASTAKTSGQIPAYAPPTTTTCSSEQPLVQHSKTKSLSGVCMSTANQPTRPTDYIDNSHLKAPSDGCISTMNQPMPRAKHIDPSYIKTPAVTSNAPLNTAVQNAFEFQRSVQTYTPKYPEFANGVPSPPLDPEEAQDENVHNSKGLSMGQPFTTPVKHGKDGTWFLGDDDEDDVVSENVQRLIRETDEAFKAVSTALAEVKEVSHSHPQTKELQTQLRHLQHTSHVLHAQTHGTKKPLPKIPTITPAYPSVRDLVSPISPTSGRGTVASRKSASPLSPPSNLLRSPTRGTSISKAKRGAKSPGRPKTPRSASFDLSPAKPGPSGPSSKSLNGHRYQHSYHRSLSKLNVTADNVTEKLFNGRFGIHRMEVEEIVTPGQVESFRLARLAKAEAEAEDETRRSTSNETIRSVSGSIDDEDSSNATTTNHMPLGPLHLQTLPSRTGNSVANAAANVLSPVVEVPTPRSFGFDFNKGRPQQDLFNNDLLTPPDNTKEFGKGQNLIVTPPPTPPQKHCLAVPNSDVASQSQVLDEDESMSLISLGLQRLLPNKPSRRQGHSRANSSSSRVPILPTIPEVNTTGSTQNDEKVTQSQGSTTSEHAEQKATAPADSGANPFFREDHDYIWLVSPAYTQNMPTIQHGPIRLAKDDLVNHGAINSIEAKLMASPDETMDWIAFQMAILGGAGDLYSNPDDFLTRDAQEDLVDDLCEWFEGFNLPANALGHLITKKENSKPISTPLTPASSLPKASPRTPHSARTTRTNKTHRYQQRQPATNDSASSKATLGREDVIVETTEEVDHSESMPIPVSTEHPSGFWNTQPFDASRFYSGSSCGIKRWTLEGHPKRYQGPCIDVEKANNLPNTRNTNTNGFSPKPMHSAKAAVKRGVRESIDSLPQSPMLDLVMTTAVDGSKDFVPMGYNLGHDLGDFLKWESEHVYASGFYGAD